ncbi:MAG: cytochrome b [Litorilituus sp.]|jgi:cytochrome b561|nr:cytochrome b [Litorilituus sp.]
MWKNSETAYGLVTKAIHWLTVVMVFGLFAVGFWMVDLTYYSPWYKTAPHWHKSVGIILLIITSLRLLWRWVNVSPLPISSHSNSVKKASKIAHLVIYVLLFVLMISGYLISTADDRAIDVFNWFSIPALGELFDKQADISGFIHQYVAYILVALSILHGAAAVKHHVIDKDETLKRMIR